MWDWCANAAGAGVAGDSGGAAGQKNGDAIDDGVAAMALSAEDGLRLKGEGVAADGADEDGEVVWSKRRHG